jgi:hypothetical protein
MKDSIKRTLKSRQIGMVQTMHLISGTATTPVDSGDDSYFVSSVTDLGTGDYKISFKEAGRRDLHVIGIVPVTARAVCRVSAIDKESVTVSVLRDDNTAMDADFYITVNHAMLVDAKF